MAEKVRTQFDCLDYQIVRELGRNVRADAAKIARAVGANERTVRNRIEQLVESGAIDLVAVANPGAFGYVTTVEVLMEVDPEREREVVERFLAMPEVAYIAFGQGPRDLAIQALFKDNGEMREFLRKTLPSIPGIKVADHMLIPRVLRNGVDWKPRPEDFGLSREKADSASV